MRRSSGKAAAALATAVALMLSQIVMAEIAPADSQPPPKIKEEPYKRIVSAQGKDTFDAFCAVCHGKDGKGGPAAAAIAKPVPDLTLIASRNNGKFDRFAVHSIIFGKERMPLAHGTVDMPIWGPIFESGDISPHTATLRMKNLVDYLQTIQQK